MDQTLRELVAILEKIAQFIRRPDTDVAWSHYSTVDEVLADIDQHITRLRMGDPTSIYGLRLLFGPTGSFQEISLSNGWGQEFLEIAARFDDAAEKLPNKPRRS